MDEVKNLKLSREGLQAHGGWTDTQIPNTINAATEAGYARDETREARAKLRGETA